MNRWDFPQPVASVPARPSPPATGALAANFHGNRVLLKLLLVLGAACTMSVPALSAPRSLPNVSTSTGNQVDLYVLQGFVGGTPCPALSDAAVDEIAGTVGARLNDPSPATPRFKVNRIKNPPLGDILGHYLGLGRPAYVVVAAVCLTKSNVAINVTGYALAIATAGGWVRAQPTPQPSTPPVQCLREYVMKVAGAPLSCTSGTVAASFNTVDWVSSLTGAETQLGAQDWSNLFGYSGSVDVFVLRTSVNGSQPCSRHLLSSNDRDAVNSMVASRLPSYTVNGLLPSSVDILAPYMQQPAPNNVIIAAICRTLDVDTISMSGYAFQQGVKPTSGALGGTFDAMETSDWSGIFGTTPLFSTVAYLPVVNDTSNVVNPRLLHNLPLTQIATPAPAPVAPPAPGAPAPPQPPTTRLAECQASAYRMLIAGRTTTSSQRPDLTRLILAGSALKFSAPQPWGTIYTVLGASAGLLYIPNSAEAGVEVFVCPPKQLLLSNPGLFSVPTGVDPTKVLFEVGGLDHAIIGHKVTSAIGLDPYVQQGVLDTAVLDLANQLDCIITQELAKMQMLNVLGSPPQADSIATSKWCTYPIASNTKVSGYFAQLEGTSDYLMQAGRDVPVTKPVSAAIQ